MTSWASFRHHRPRLVVALAGAAALVLLALALAPARPAAAQTGPTAVITAASLNVRSGPGPGYSVVTTVSGGTTVTLLGRVDDSSWVRVRLPGGAEGWISSYYITTTTPLASLPVLAASEPWGTLTATVFLRAGPGQQYAAIATLPAGTLVNVLARDAATQWIQVRASGTLTGWVSSGYIVGGVSLTRLPVSTATTPPPAAPGAPAAPAPGAGIYGTAASDKAELPVYSNPGFEHNVITKIMGLGTPMSVLGRAVVGNNETWLYILYDGSTLGWVTDDWVKTGLNVDALPLIPTSAPVGVNLSQAVIGSVTGPAAPAPGAPAAPGQVALGTAYVNAPAVNVRLGPNTAYPSAGTAVRNTRLDLLGRNAAASWVYVRTPGGLTGWVAGGELLIQMNPSDLPVVGTTTTDGLGSAVVLTGGLNIRSGPGLGFFSIGVAYQRDVLVVLGRDASGNWLRVRTPGGLTGWVASGNVGLDVPLRSLPVLDGTAEEEIFG